jgi:raffinose/stachyose/melibiose transport system permease protein
MAFLTRTGAKPSNRFNYVILTVLSAFSLLPLVILVMNSFKTTGEISANPLGLPMALQFENYVKAWTTGRFATAIPNTLFLIVLTVVGVWLIAGMAAYSLARLKPAGGNTFIMYLMLVVSLPIQATVFVLFNVWSQLDLVDNLWGLVPIYIANQAPFSTVLLRSFMVAIPGDFEDAARVDGASNWQVFRQIILPLTWPGFLTAGLLAALNVWNEFFLAVTFIQTPALKPVSTSLYGFIASTRFQEWGVANAASVIMMLPVLIFFLFLQRHFIVGITQGGLK